MVSVETIREFLGWCTVSNFGLMMFALVLVIRDWASKLHARMFGLDEVSVRRAYFQYFINYKIGDHCLQLSPIHRLENHGRELTGDVWTVACRDRESRHNKAMNTEPPTAHLQMEDRPRRPGYRKRSDILLSRVFGTVQAASSAQGVCRLQVSSFST